MFTAKTLTVAEYNCELKPFHPAVKVTIADTSVALQTLNFADLKKNRVDRIDATDGVLTLSVAQYQALKSVKLAADDVVTLLDAGQTIACLTLTEIQALASKGIDIIDASDDALTLSVEQLTALGAVALSGGDMVTLCDTGEALAGLTMEQILSLASKGIDAINVTGPLALTVAQATALLATSLTLTADDISVADTGAALSSLTAEQIAALPSKGINGIDATDGNLTLSLAQYQALGPLTLASDDVVTVSAPGADLGALLPSDFADFAAKGVDALDASDDALVLTLDQYLALGPVKLTGGDAVTLSGTGEALAGLTTEQLAALAGNGIDALDATDNALTLSLEQLTALGPVTLTGGDTVTLSDTGTVVGNLSPDELAALASKGIDVIDVDGTLTLTTAQAVALAGAGITFAAGDVVSIADTGAALGGLTAEQMAALAAAGMTFAPIANEPLVLTVAQYRALGASMPTAEGGVVLVDTGVALASLTVDEMGSLAGGGVTALDAVDNVLALSLAQFVALGTVSLTSADTVTLSDTGAALSSLATEAVAALAGKDIDGLDASDGNLTLSVAQFEALGAVALSEDDVITLQASQSYTLPDHVSHLELKDAAATGTGNSLGNFLWGNDANNVLFGMSGDDALFGGSGSDQLMGGSGVDWMEGGAGDDIYSVDAAADQVIEAAGEGTDTVYASVSYTLAAATAVETLRTTSTIGTSAINLTGNSLANILIGNAGANKLDGKGGTDTMSGHGGNDTYYVDRAGDQVKETSSGGTADRVYTTVSHTLAANVENLYASGTASIRLTGTTKNNTIYGNSGANKINGGYGNDVLKGGLGKDAFIFTTKLSSKSNLDRITDFSVKDDSLYLDNALFKKLGSGSMSSPKKLSSSFFTVGDKAKDGNDYVIYNKSTGVLSYDADGSGSGGAVAVAKLSKNLAMTSSDIYII